MSPEPKPRSMAAVTITVLRSKETLALVKFGYLLEHPSIFRYSSNIEQLESDNPRSADNQQERPTRKPSRVGILRDHTPNNCRATVEEMVRTAWRHAGVTVRCHSLIS